MPQAAATPILPSAGAVVLGHLPSAAAAGEEEMSEAEVPTDGPAYTSKSGRPRLRVHLGALLIFSIATVVTYGELWQRGASSEVVFKTWGELESSTWKGLKLDSLGHASRADVIFESWLVARNARTLATRPLRLFDTEQCAPAEKTLTLGIPMITMGVLAIPTWFATGDPILTFNVTTVALNWVAALAMYWLVMSWTGVPAAGHSHRCIVVRMTSRFTCFLPQF